MITLNPYISFHTNARDALEFYQSVLGGELDISTFAAFDMGQEAAENELVMHGQLETPHGLTLMASDTPSFMPFVAPAGISISISGDDEAALESYWNGLADGGTVNQPFETPPWGGRFGTLTDKFGIDWMLMLNVAAEA